MAKHTKRVAEAAKAYIQQLKSQFPDLEATPAANAFDGFDVWIRVELPPGLEDQFDEVIYATTELNFKFWDETGISVTATVEEREPVHG